MNIDGFSFPDNLHYRVDYHVWLRVEKDGNVVVGVADSGQQLAGRIIYVESKEPGSKASMGRPIFSIESAKWAGRIPALVNGTVIEVNQKLREKPSLINESPYSEGWVIKIKPTDLASNLKRLVTGEKAEKKFRDEISKLRLKKV